MASNSPRRGLAVDTGDRITAGVMIGFWVVFAVVAQVYPHLLDTVILLGLAVMMTSVLAWSVREVRRRSRRRLQYAAISDHITSAGGWDQLNASARARLDELLADAIDVPGIINPRRSVHGWADPDRRR
jgi:hypothetical protein